MTTIQDSGKREQFETGSQRDTREGKGRYDLLSPSALRRLARHMEAGSKKYGERNWEKGQPLSRYFDSAVRHLYAFADGMTDEDHVAAALWNIHALAHTQVAIADGRLPVELDDFPPKT